MSKKPKYHRPPHGLIIDLLPQGVLVRPKASSDALTKDAIAQILAVALKDALKGATSRDSVMKILEEKEELKAAQEELEGES